MMQGLDEPAESETHRFIEILNLAASHLLTAAFQRHLKPGQPATLAHRRDENEAELRNV